jgi:ElaB/YqjD/DUF883 family membrane-anchored ribosome-binding protein
MTTLNTQHLARDLKSVIASLEDLLSTTAEGAGDALHETRKHMERSLKDARETLADLEEKTVREVKATARATDRYVHDNPWQTIGMAAGIGVLIGLLLGRRER